MKHIIFKNKFNFLIFTLYLFCSNSFNCQNFYPRNFSDLYAINKDENNSLVPIINREYLNLKNFYAVNDSVFTNKNNDEFIAFSFKLNDLKFYEVKVDYYVDDPKKIINILKQTKIISEIALEKVNQNKYSSFEQYSSDKRYFAKYLVEKNKIYQDRSFNKLQIVFRENLTDINGIAYKWKNYEHQLSNAYPLQNSVWYFDTKITSDSNIDNSENNKITTTIYLSQIQKYPHKIEFLNDEIFKLTYNGKNTQIINGTYKTYSREFGSTDDLRIDIEFKTNIKSNDITKSIAKKSSRQKKTPIEIPEPNRIRSKNILDLKVGSLDYLSSLFNNYYQLEKTTKADIFLIHFVQSNYNAKLPPAVAPNLSDKKK